MTLVVQLTAVAAVVLEKDFIAKSRASKEALKSANLLKSLNINALIIGDRGVGKNTLARHILDAFTVDGSKFKELLKALETNNNLIIKNFDKISNFEQLKKAIKANNNKIIAISENPLSNSVEDDFFSLKIHLPPLVERREDVVALSNIFYDEAKEIYGELINEFDLNQIELDLSENIYSLKKSVYFAYLKNSLTSNDVQDMLEQFLISKLGSGNDYRELLYIFDIPLIKSGFKKYGSQLAMSKAFGINRNTLRKKITEYKLEQG
jgi:DNA-binding NtrC family response regulator